MMEFLLNLDNQIFILLNSQWDFFLLDILMVAITYLGKWPWVFFPLLIFCMVKGGRRGKSLGFILIGLLALGDILGHYVLKPYFDRPRPFLVLDSVRLLTDVTSLGPLGFPSNHAINIMSIASLFSLVYRNRLKLIFFFMGSAFLVCYSRIYIGVHYPLDVMGGSLVGALLGSLGFALYHYIEKNSPIRWFRA